MHKLFHTAVSLAAFVGMSIGALAADLPRYQPPPPPAPPPYVPPPFCWTGWYFGGNVGGAWTHREVTDDFFGLTFSGPDNKSLFIGGLQLGADYQFGNLVAGFEADLDWSANNNNTGVEVAVPRLGTVRSTFHERWISTLAARFGVAFDRWLVYGKAGGGWIGTNTFSLEHVTRHLSVAALDANQTYGGLLVGGGIEWAFSLNWSAKLEYDYLQLNGRTFTLPLTAPFLANDTFTIAGGHIQMVKVGINYRFDLDPIRGSYW